MTPEKRKRGRCSLCLKRFGSEASFRSHADTFHKKRASEAAFLPDQPTPDKEPTREWEFYHLSRGWPI